MKELQSIKQKRYADNLLEAGFSRMEISEALQIEFGITLSHAKVLVYRWYVGKEFKIDKKDRKTDQKRSVRSKLEALEQQKNEGISGDEPEGADK